MLMDEYGAVLTSAIEKILSTQREKMIKAADMIKDTISNDGLIYVFGCGHSHILAEETFYRAGGLACVSPVFNEPLMLHESASWSSHLEKESGHAQEVLRDMKFSPEDTFICVSTSGINGVPVEVAAAVKEQGIKLIGIASDAYLGQNSRSVLGLHLQDICDVCIDNAAPYGDACLKPEGLSVKMTPVSTVTGTFIINSILVEAVDMALRQNIEPPIYLSGNITGGTEYNQSLIERYSGRIKCL